MGWGDIERGLGNVAAIPGKILGSVAGPIVGGLRSDPDAAALLSGLPAAYAMGRGDYQGAAQMRAMQYQRQQQELQRQRMENFHAQMEEIFPNGSGFNPSNMDHANQYVRAAIRAGYLFPQAYQMLGTVQSAMAQQAQANLQRFERINPKTGLTEQYWFNPADGTTGPVSGPAGDSLPGSPAEVEGGGAQSPAGKIFSDIEVARDLLETLDPGSQEYNDLSKYIEAQERNFFGATGGVTTSESRQREFDIRSKIVKDYNDQMGGKAYEMIMKQYESIRGAYEQWVSSYNSEDREANAQFYGIMGVTLNKILDPKSVVRESEFARLIAFQGLEGKFKTFLAQQESGAVDPDLMADIMDAANVLARTASEVQVPRYESVKASHRRYLPDLPDELVMQGLINPAQKLEDSGFGLVPRVWSDPVVGGD